VQCSVVMKVCLCFHRCEGIEESEHMFTTVCRDAGRKGE
jgi:hypothetical protein